MFALVLAAAIQATPIDLPRLLDELVDRAALARFPEPEYRARVVTRMDQRSGIAGSDAQFLLDVEGPGVITRIAATNPRGRLRIFLEQDDADDAGLVVDADMRSFLTGAGGVLGPLASERAGCANFHLPIPFARRARIFAIDSGELDYHVEWRDYADDVPVVSLARGDVERHADAIARVNRAWRDGRGPEGDPTFRYHLSREAPEGELLALGAEHGRGPRAVTEIRLLVDARDPAAALLASTLVLEFDGETTVRVPLGAFFGAHEDFRPISSWFVSIAPPGELVARFVMPYRESFALRVENHGDRELHLSGSVRTTPWTWDERSMHFHASWRASGVLTTQSMRLWLPFARVRGRGVFVGDVLATANPVPERWRDAFERIVVDGEGEARRSGTETDGLYGYAASDTSLFQTALHGRTRSDGPLHFGRADAYRFRVLDAIPFEREIDCVQELMHSVETTHERTTCAYYYARPGAVDVAPPIAMDPEARAPRIRVTRVAGAIEAETVRVVATSDGLPHEVVARPESTLSGGLQLFVRAQHDGDFIEFEIPSEPGRRSIRALLTQSGSGGIVRFSIDGDVVGAVFDGRSTSGLVEGPVEFDLGEHDVGRAFTLRAVVVGTSVTHDGPQRSFGIDAVVVR